MMESKGSVTCGFLDGLGLSILCILYFFILMVYYG
jgi:hypothetical protein